MSTIKVNKIEKRTGSTLELGGPGTAVTLACGATQTGFGRTGTVDWCTTAKTSPFTAVSGDGFFVNTTSGAITVTLPSSPLLEILYLLLIMQILGIPIMLLFVETDQNLMVNVIMQF